MTPQEIKAEREAEARARREREKYARTAYRSYRSTAATYDPAGWERGRKAASKINLRNDKAAGDKKKEVE
jgi:hypothetical protein